MNFFLGNSLHADEQTATMPFPARPALYVRIQRFPTAKVKITHAEIGSVRNSQSFFKRGQKVVFYIVENSRHSFTPFALNVTGRRLIKLPARYGKS
jgi:hypothetical protein